MSRPPLPPGDRIPYPPRGRSGSRGFFGLWRIRDEVAYLVGTLLLLMALLFFMVGVSMLQDEDPEMRDSGWPAIGICTPTFLIPALVFLYQGYRWGRRQKLLTELADYVNLRREVPVGELARATQLTEVEAMARLWECFEKGLVDGYLDPTRVVFTTVGTQGSTGRRLPTEAVAHRGTEARPAEAVAHRGAGARPVVAVALPGTGAGLSGAGVTPSGDGDMQFSETQRRILALVKEQPGISGGGLASALGITGAAVQYHTDALLAAGRLRRKWRGLWVAYYLG